MKLDFWNWKRVFL